MVVSETEGRVGPAQHVGLCVCVCACTLTCAHTCVEPGTVLDMQTRCMWVTGSWLLFPLEAAL